MHSAQARAAPTLTAAVTQTSPDTGVTTNSYDYGGNLDTSTEPRGVVTDYDYDAANRVISTS